MIGKVLHHKLSGQHQGVPWRSHEVLRIEALSDAVFAFAVTLLIVSLEVPHTFHELEQMMRGFVAFVFTFATLIQVWYSQHIFFRRFGLQDKTTILLNATLLFVVLFYVYPLKFLSSFLVSQFTGGKGMVQLPNGHMEPMIGSEEETRQMMMIYSSGFTAVFLIFTLLYLYVWRNRDPLELSPQERFDCGDSIIGNGLQALVGLTSLLFAWLLHSASLAGYVYLSIAVLQTLHGTIAGTKRRKRFEGVAVQSTH